MKIEKDDIIVFVGEYSAHAQTPTDSLLKLSEEEQQDKIREAAKEYFLPLSLGKGIDVVVGKRLLSVYDKKRILDDIKQIKKDRAKQQYEQRLEQLDKIWK